MNQNMYSLGSTSLKIFLSLLIGCFKIVLGGQSSICALGYDELSNSCLRCSPDYYRESIEGNKYFSLDECKPKDKSVELKKTVWISNYECATSSPCNGDFDSPFDDIFNAFYMMNMESNKFRDSSINFFLLGSEHYLLQKQLQKVVDYSPFFFLGLKAKIMITPWYCDQGEVLGCLQNRNQKVTLRLKTNNFHIFFSESLFVSNIIFDGSDIHIETQNDPNLCASSKIVCCDDTAARTQTHSCFIYNQSYDIITGSDKLGLFISDRMLGDNGETISSLKITDCEFNNIYLLKRGNSGFHSMLILTELATTINLTNIIFSNIYFQNGIVNLVLSTVLYKKAVSDVLEPQPHLNFNNLDIRGYNNYLVLPINLTPTIFQLSNSLQTNLIISKIFIHTSPAQPFLIFYFINAGMINIKDIAITELGLHFLLYAFDTNIQLENINIYEMEFSNSLKAPYIKAVKGDWQITGVIFSLVTFVLQEVPNPEYIIDLSNVNSLTIENGIIFGGRNCIWKLTYSNFKIIQFLITTHILDISFFYIKNTNFEMQNFEIYLTSFLYNDVFFIRNDGPEERDLSINNLNISKSYILSKKLVTKIFNWPISQSYDFFKLDGFVISSVYVRYYLSFFDNSIFPYVDFKNILIINVPYPLTLVNLFSFQEFRISNLTLQNSIIGYYVLTLSCELCILNVSDITLDGIQLQMYDAFYFQVPFGTFQRFKISNFTSIDEGLRIFLLVGFTEAYLYDMNINLDTDLTSAPMDFLFFLYWTWVFNIKLMKFSVPQGSTLSLTGLFNIVYTEITLMEAIVAENFNCNPLVGSIAKENGIINFLGSSSYMPEDFPASVSIQDLKIKNCINCINGAIGFVSYFEIKMSNLSFYNCSSYQGGALSIRHSLVTEIFLLLVEYSNAFNGGALFTYNATSLLADNIIIRNASAHSGGAILIRGNKKTVIQYSLFYDLFANSMGGAISCLNSYLELMMVNIANSSCDKEGGALYISRSLLSVLGNFSSHDLKADIGGFMLSMESDYLYMRGMVIYNSYALAKGSAFQFIDCAAVKMISIALIFNSVPAGSGTVNAESQSSSGFEFSDIFCANNMAIQGSCFFFFTNNYTNIINSSFVNNIGSVITTTSPTPYERSELKLNNIEFQGNNLNQSELVPDYLIIGDKADLIIRNVTFKENIFRNSFVYFMDCFSNISEVHFQEKESLFSESFYPSLFEYHSCSVFADSIYFKGHERRDIQLIYTISSNISFENSIVNTCLTSDFSCFLIEKSFVRLFNMTFFNCTGSRSGAAYFANSIAIIVNCSFINNNVKISSASLLVDVYPNDIELFEGEQSLITNTLFKTVNGISTRCVRNNNTIIKGSFYSGSGSFQTKAIYVLESNISIFTTNFTNFSSSEGGCLYFFNKNLQSKNEILIMGCRFSDNTAYFGGVFYIKGYFPLTRIEDNNFQGNQASSKEEISKSGIGGVGFCVCLKCKESNIFLKGNLFFGNRADHYGKTIISQTVIFHRDNSNVETNIFENNIDNSGLVANLTYLPIKIEHGFINSNLTESELFSMNDNSYFDKLINSSSNVLTISSGDKFQYLVILRDSKDEVLSIDFFARAILSEVASINRSFFRIENKIAKCTQGLCFFSGTKVNTYPNSSFQLRLSFEFTVRDILPDSLEESLIPDVNIVFFTRPCVKGELYVKGDQTCLKCPYGKYSFSNPMGKNSDEIKCKDCPENAECLGGDIVTPLSGYWRASEESTLILECLSKTSCLGNQKKGNQSDAVHGLCEEYHHGVFCYTCEQGYARNFPKDICRPCRKNIFLYFKMIIAMFLLLLYIGFQVHLTFKANTSSNAGILMKQLINHFQQIGMISLVDLGWTPDIKSYFSFQEYFSFLSEEFITIDCFVAEIGYDLLTQKIIFTNILPIFLSILALLIWLLSFYLSIYVKRSGSQTIKKVFDKVRVSIMIIVYLLFPEILRKCFSLVNCIVIDNNTEETRLMYSPEIKCWDTKHVTYIMFAALPGLLLWGVVTPLFIYNLLRIHKKFIMAYIRSMNRFENKASLHDQAFDLLEEIRSGKLSEVTMETQKNNNNKNRFLYFFRINDKIKTRRIGPEPSTKILDNKNSNENSFFLEESFKEKVSKRSFDLKGVENKNIGLSGPRKSDLALGSFKQFAPPVKIIEMKQKQNNYFPPSGFDSASLRNNSTTRKFEEDARPSFTDKNLAEEKVPQEVYGFTETSKWKLFLSLRFWKALFVKFLCCNYRTILPTIQINRKEESQLRRETGVMLKFLYKGYSPKMYFWEMVMFSKKFILILIGSFNDVFPSNTKAIILLISMTFYIWLQTKYKPFETDYLNNIEYFSLITSFLTANMGIMLFTEDLKKVSQMFLIFIILFNASYVINWFRYLKKHVLNKINFKKLIKEAIFKRWTHGTQGTHDDKKTSLAS